MTEARIEWLEDAIHRCNIHSLGGQAVDECWFRHDLL
jgi:hypothetical protein